MSQENKISRSGQITGTIVMGVAILVVVLFLQYLANLIGPYLATTDARTESAQATVDYAEPGGMSMVVKYHFRYQGNNYNGEANCERCLPFYQEAKREGIVTVWFDPNDPLNSSWEQPKTGLSFFLKGLYIGLIAYMLGTYAAYLNILWGWKNKLKELILH